MRHIFAKTAVAGLLVLGMTSCANDLNISSVDPQTSTSYEDMQLLAKVYGTLGMTGQKGPAGSGDISSDEGESGFYRTTFNLETLPTDRPIPTSHRLQVSAGMPTVAVHSGLISA